MSAITQIFGDANKPITLDFFAKQVFVFNPTRGFIWLNTHDATIPTAQTANIIIPPQSERQLPLDGIQQMGLAVQLPNPTNPAVLTFRQVPQLGALGGVAFSTPVDPPIPLTSAPIVGSFASQIYTVNMVGRWLRFHWSVGGTAASPLNITLTDGFTRFRWRVLKFVQAPVVNFSDFAFRTNQTISIILIPDNPSDNWNISLWYEFIDRAEFPFPQAFKMSSRGQFVQFGAAAINVPQTFNITRGFKIFAMGAHVRGNGALTKSFQLTLYDTGTAVPYFEIQPNNYGPATAPVDPDFAIILPGDVQNFPAGGSAGQTLPVGSVSAFSTGGPQFDYQLSRGLNVTVLAESTLTLIPLDNPILFANVFLECEEPF